MPCTPAHSTLSLEPLGTYHTNIFDEGAAEIVVHDPMTQQLFVINANANAVDILSITAPNNPVPAGHLSVAGDIAESGRVKSFAVHNGLVALAVENDNKQQNGWIAFYDTDGTYLNHIQAGALPDMVAFTPNGRYVLAANEGEPSSDYSVDPEGTITVVDLSDGVFSPQVKTAHFNDIGIPDGVRLPGPEGTTQAQDLEPAMFPDAAILPQDENLGRLKIVNTEGDIDGDGDFDQLFSYGARSISIWSADGDRVYDSGDTMEQEMATAFPERFNSTNDESDSFDNRSDDKGPEPEGVVVSKVAGRYYAFVGLERMGGIMIFDITESALSRYAGYFNTGNFEVEDIESAEVGDLGPEGLAFIREDNSPTGEPLLVVGKEVSGTTTLYAIEKVLTHK